MKQLLDEAMSDGALGLSTMLASPRELAVTTDDLVALCQVVKRHGGIYSSHIRNEGTDVFDAVKEAIAVGQRARDPGRHHPPQDRRPVALGPDERDRRPDRRRRGARASTCRPTSIPTRAATTTWSASSRPGPTRAATAALLARLKDRSLRDRLKHDIRAGLPGWYNHYTAVGGDWTRMLDQRPAQRRRTSGFEGQTMDRIIAAKSAGQDPAPDPLDVLFDFLIEEDGSIGTIYAHHTEEDMNLALVQPWCSIGSDGSALAIEGPLRRGHPHPRNFGTFPRVLGVYVRNRQLLRLEDAVRKMTSLNAAKVGLLDRGLLRPGLFADVTLFDPNTVIDQSTYLEPFQYSTGIEYVIVNGQLVLERGRQTHVHAGTRLAARSDEARTPSTPHEKKPASDQVPNDYLSLSRSNPDRLAGSLDELRTCSSRREAFGSRKGERGVVRGNPLALWRGAAPIVLKRLSPMGWILLYLAAVSLIVVR